VAFEEEAGVELGDAFLEAASFLVGQLGVGNR
jgi:hypothetical protein